MISHYDLFGLKVNAVVDFKDFLSDLGFLGRCARLYPSIAYSEKNKNLFNQGPDSITLKALAEEMDFFLKILGSTKQEEYKKTHLENLKAFILIQGKLSLALQSLTKVLSILLTSSYCLTQEDKEKLSFFIEKIKENYKNNQSYYQSLLSSVDRSKDVDAQKEKEENANLKRQLDEIERENKKLKKDKEENLSLKEQLNAAKRENQELRKENLNLKEELVIATQHKESALTLASQREVEKQELTRKLGELKKELQQAEQHKVPSKLNAGKSTLPISQLSTLVDQSSLRDSYQSTTRESQPSGYFAPTKVAPSLTAKRNGIFSNTSANMTSSGTEEKVKIIKISLKFSEDKKGSSPLKVEPQNIKVYFNNMKDAYSFSGGQKKKAQNIFTEGYLGNKVNPILNSDNSYFMNDTAHQKYTESKNKYNYADTLIRELSEHIDSTTVFEYLDVFNKSLSSDAMNQIPQKFLDNIKKLQSEKNQPSLFNQRST